jgi:hypothetical protein
MRITQAGVCGVQRGDCWPLAGEGPLAQHLTVTSPAVRGDGGRAGKVLGRSPACGLPRRGVCARHLGPPTSPQAPQPRRGWPVCGDGGRAGKVLGRAPPGGRHSVGVCGPGFGAANIPAAPQPRQGAWPVLWGRHIPALPASPVTRGSSNLSSSTVSEPPFVYVQRSQEVMLFPVIEACKLVALQTPFPFMPHT